MKKLLRFVSLFAFTFSLSTSLYAQTISTAAGNGTAGYSGDGGQATAAQLNLPTGICSDANNNIVFADYSNNRIRVINTLGVISTIAGNGTASFFGDGGQATAAELDGSSGVSIDGFGNIYIADANNRRIREVNSSGIISTIAGNGTSGFSGDGGQATAAELSLAYGVSSDASGNVYIADYANQRIRKVNSSGIISTIAGNGTGGYSGDGGQATAAELNGPIGVYSDASGTVYISDYSNNRIRKVSTSGIISTLAGNGIGSYSGDGGQATAASLYYPCNVCSDASGNIYIADGNNERVRVVNASGIISTFAGTGTLGYSGDGGPATAADLDRPFGLCVAPSGNLYLADEDNNRVREISGAALSVNELTLVMDGVTVYPNPSNGKFTIQSTAGSGPKSVTIYNVLGEKVYSQSFLNLTAQYSIDISNQPAGIYLYRIRTETGNLISTGKLIIQK